MPVCALVFFQGRGFYAWLIALAQRLRFGGAVTTTRFNHVAIMLDDRGTLVEALSRGVRRTQLDDHAGDRCLIVPLALSDEDHAELARYVQSAVGARYDWFTILTIGLHLLTGGKLSLSLDNADICSGLASHALEHAGYCLPFNATTAMPAEVAQYLLDERNHP